MNDRTELFNKIMALPVFDTHTHLETGYRSGTDGFYARQFFDICDYFWFKRELAGLGYQREKTFDPTSLREAEKLHDALVVNRNTFWTQAIYQAMDDLYNIRPDTPSKILELGEVMNQNLTNRDWGNHVCDKIGVQKTVMGPGGTPEGTFVHVDKDVIADRIVEVPVFRLGKSLPSWDPEDPELHLKLDTLKQETLDTIQRFVQRGWSTVRLAWPFKREHGDRDDFTAAELEQVENLSQHMGHFVMDLFQQQGFSLQIFFGTGPGGPLNDPGYLASMWPVFAKYPGVNFELFSMAQLSSLDIVQAARIYPNVYPGGLWWYTFRPGIYEENMRYRAEGISAARSTFVASDARCIEWSYIKIRVVKKVMANFFHKQIQEGWMDEDIALYTAKCWLHDTAYKLYMKQDP